MKNKIQTILSAFIILFAISACDDKEQETLDKYELPASISGHQIITHEAYMLSYNEYHEQADWVAYELTKEEATANEVDRTDDFRADPAVETGSAELSDYDHSGYDRGHLAPAGDMGISYQIMSESFFMSNMSPQKAGLNRGKWKTLESQVRDWAIQYGKVYVATGGILHDDLLVIGANEVSVPEKYYKVILDYENKKAIAFIMKNENLMGDISSYAVTVDEAEKQTGLDFFIFLPDGEQSSIEATLNLDDWNFTHR